MKRTQIQIPERLYREIQRVAVLQEWSVAEVIRRGAEEIVRAYSPIKDRENSRLPPPISSTLLVSDAGELRDLLRHDQEVKGS